MKLQGSEVLEPKENLGAPEGLFILYEPTPGVWYAVPLLFLKSPNFNF